MPTPSNAFQFYNTGLEGLNLVTRGLVYEYDGTSVEYITGVGLVTGGLVYGLGDFWKFADNAQTISWTLVN